MIPRTNLSPEKVFLKPGDLVTAEEPVIVTTVLGSCISVTMFHPKTGVAAICHAMQPKGGGNTSFKYVDSSIQHMVRFFSHQKIRVNEIQVKLFGGAEMFNNAEQRIRDCSVGSQNIIVAEQCLRANGLVPMAVDVGGKKGRKIIFKTDSGTVFLKRLNNYELEPFLKVLM